MKQLVFFGVVVAIAAYFGTYCCHQKEADVLFQYPNTTIWGRSNDEDTSVTPFTVKIDPKYVEDLQRRLAMWRRHEPMPDPKIAHKYGIAGEWLDNLVKYWREKYDFNSFEAKMNSVSGFTTVIQGLRVHFLHAEADPKATKRVPMVIVHGWAGSIVEFYHVIPLLTAVGEDGVAFDVVAPSLPGFGFSEAAVKPGFSPLAMAPIVHQLMLRLGYEKYIYQGGDWGSVIGSLASRLYPNNIIGYHANMMVIPTYTLRQRLHLAAALFAPKWVLDEKDAEKLLNLDLKDILEESGYFHVQATKPDTLGVGLSDSPVGLLAWISGIFDKLSERAEFRGEKGGISNEDLIHNVMLYWLSNHVTSSTRIYKEFVQQAEQIDQWEQLPITIPSGFTCYPLDLPCSPRALLRHKMPNLVHYQDIPRGGHFAALEEPEAFNNDFRIAAAAILRAREEQAQTAK